VEKWPDGLSHPDLKKIKIKIKKNMGNMEHLE
jgi:hypothetical protein